MEQAQARRFPLLDAVSAAIDAEGRPAIAADGATLSAISFYHYMSLCLYHPEFGYYRSGFPKVGREGDFYTSSSIGDVMGETLAGWLREAALARFGPGAAVEVLDWGGGTGRLSRQMLDAWAASSDRPEDGAAPAFAVTVVDGNPAHRREAERELAAHIRAGTARVSDETEWEKLLAPDRPVIVVANELLDAFPVHRLVMQDGKLSEWGVARTAEGRLVPCLMEPTDVRLADWLAEEGVELLDGQTVEANLDAAAWAADIAVRFARALLVLIDYGDETAELISPHRMDGTLLCYYRHRAHNDPYQWPGEQDLTAHVNFSHIRRSVEKRGGRQIWYGSQKRFLVEAGLLERLTAHGFTDPFHPVVRRNRAIRQLLLSDGMSELFKVQVFAIGRST
ncbi:class I SAM-dependent methyltransferase [Cohnella hongkongensis]|uniref:Class I SAM-dependent methyltransferase n=1 Tax=Cohnella hongkongensis TaxID=178337 RepID=A0ABV9FBR2_9BACL